MLSDNEKYNNLCILMEHYHQENFPFNKSVMPRTKVFKLVVEKITGKIRMKKNDKQYNSSLLKHLVYQFQRKPLGWRLLLDKSTFVSADLAAGIQKEIGSYKKS